MAFFLYIVLASLVSCTAGQYFECDQSSINKDPEACTATKWCLWSTANGGTGTCIYDTYLKYIPAIEGAACADPGKLFYITDILDCDDGTPISQADLYCRGNNSLWKKQPIDECFYQDLKSRETGNGKKCTNLDGGIACTEKGSGSNTYCVSTGDKTCSAYLDDDDLPGLCNCLGPSRCNLYPHCAISKASGGPCVADPCASAVPSGSACTGNIAGVSLCKVANVQKVDDAGSLNNYAYCYSDHSDSTVKKNEFNPCYYGVQQKVTYPGWNAQLKNPGCQNVTEQNKCADIAQNQCQSVDIAAGWFSSAQGHYCTDGQNRNVPSPDAALVLGLPSILFLLSVVIAAIL